MSKTLRFTKDLLLQRLRSLHDTKYTLDYIATKDNFNKYKNASVLVPLFIKKGEVGAYYKLILFKGFRYQ